MRWGRFLDETGRDDILAETTRVNETTPACAYTIRATVKLGVLWKW